MKPFYEGCGEGPVAEELSSAAGPCSTTSPMDQTPRDVEMKRARFTLGGEVKVLREAVGMNSLRLAELSGISPAAVRRVELGGSGIVQKIIRIARVLGCGRDIFRRWLTLWTEGAVVDAADAAYFRAMLEAVDNDAEPNPADASMSVAREQIALRGKGLVALAEIDDVFSGADPALRRKAAREWWERIHPCQRALDGSRRYVWEFCVLPCNLTAREVLRSARGVRGRCAAPITLAAWEYFIGLVVDQRMTPARAHKAVLTEGWKRNWRWPFAERSARSRISEFFKTFPEWRR
jgi:transcriptional regulator with XRE-family HTH domain